MIVTLVDVLFNSALDYELCVLKLYVTPLLKAVPPKSEHYTTARELLRFLENFQGVPHDFVSDIYGSNVIV